MLVIRWNKRKQGTQRFCHQKCLFPIQADFWTILVGYTFVLCNSKKLCLKVVDGREGVFVCDSCSCVEVIKWEGAFSYVLSLFLVGTSRAYNSGSYAAVYHRGGMDLLYVIPILEW